MLSRKWYMVFSVALSAVLCLGGFADAVYAAEQVPVEYTVHEPYVYPVDPGTDEWFAMESRAERAAVCQVPSDILGNMDIDALVETVATYPFLFDIMLYNSAEEGYSSMRQDFNGLRELERRPDAAEALVRFLSDGSGSGVDWSDDISMKAVLFAGPFLPSGFSVDGGGDTVGLDCEELYLFYEELAPEGYDFENGGPTQVPAGCPTTPSGTVLSDSQAFNYADRPLFSEAALSGMESTLYEQYGLMPVRRGNPRYNCHSYAWWDQSEGNTWWIERVEPYVSDPLVSQVYGMDNLRLGDLITYRSTPVTVWNHSGVITGLHPNGSVVTPMVASKWGEAGVYIHTIANCPYSTSGLHRFWRKQ